ncbi:MAG: DUF4271 domain-containing protein, partial [Saprospiraceae bacterium]
YSVSHKPNRKNQYQQIEQLKNRDSSAEESISISYLPLWVIAFSMSLLAFVLVRRKHHIMSLLRSIFNVNLMRLMANEENNGLSISYLSGYLLFLINLALFIFLVGDKTFANGMQWGYFMIFIAALAFFWGKHLFLFLFGKLYEFEKEATLYGFTIVSFYNILGLFFLSFNILLLFGPDSWIRPIAILGIGVFLIFLISRYYKGLYIARNYLNRNFFHFFLYFCAFELSPWVMLYSLFRDFI